MLQKYDDSNPANQIELTSRFRLVPSGTHDRHVLWCGSSVQGARHLRLARGRALLHRALSGHDDRRVVILSIASSSRAPGQAGKVSGRSRPSRTTRASSSTRWVGIWLLFAFLPAGTLWWVAGFAAFRFFDIMKLPPVDIIDEKMKNGAGVMLDDVVAAFYAWVVVSILGWLFG